MTVGLSTGAVHRKTNNVFQTPNLTTKIGVFAQASARHTNSARWAKHA